MNLDHSSDGSLKIVPLWLRGIEDLNWMCTTRDTQQGSVTKVGLELASIEGGTHDDDLEVLSLLRDLEEENT